MRSRIPIVALVGALVGGAACAPPAPAPPAAIESDGTLVAVVVGDRFGLVVRRDDGGGAGATSPSCPALSLALRLPTDDGKWVDPTDPAPRDDVELWTSAGARAVEQGDADGRAWDIDLVDAAGVVRGVARVVAAAGAEGFVDLDVSFPFDDEDIAYVAACFDVAGQHLVGGGERFDGPDLAGRITPLVFSAPGPFASGTNEAHAPVPFFATTGGLGVLVETERVGAFDAASFEGAVELRFHGSSLPLRVRAARPRAHGAGGDVELIVDNVAAHARRMGLPRPPPRWALAPMQWRNDLEVERSADGALASSGTDMLLADVAAMVDRDLPFSTVWIDAPWETGYNTFVFNEAQLPAIDDAIDALAQHGLHPLVWATEHVNVSDDSDQAFGMPPFASRALYDRFAEQGLLVLDGNGEPFTFPWGRGQGAFVDFTNPAACAAWQAEMAPLLARGVRGFKLDYGESMRPDVLGLVPNTVPAFFDGSTTAVQHTRYARLYHQCYAGALQQAWGDDWFIITRTGGIFDQQNGVAIWPGDLDSDFSGLGDDLDGDRAVGGVRSAIAGSLSLAMSGYPLYGADIGGYRGARATPEAFVRFAEASVVQTVFQVGGGGNQTPWDPEYADVADAFDDVARLRMSLWPMFEAWLARASRGGDGTPVVVPLGVVAGSDEAWADTPAQVLGDALAAYPVVVDGARSRSARLPAGAWFDLWTGTPHEGVADADAPLGRPPLFLRAGAVLVLDRESRTLLPSPARGGPAPDRVVVVAPGPASGSSSVVAGGVTVAQRTDTDGVVVVDVEAAGGAIPLVVEVLGVASVDDVVLDGADGFDAAVIDGRLTLTSRAPVEDVTLAVRPRR